MTKIMTENEIQQTRINELINLVQQNPELKIVPMVDGELCGNEFSYYMGNWGKAELDEVYLEDERIYFRLGDEEELVEKRADLIFEEEYPGRKQLTDEEDKTVTKKAENYVKDLPWEKVIVVKIGMP